MPPADPSTVATARDRLEACITDSAHWRGNAERDLKFRAGTGGADGNRSYQWPEAAQNERNTDGRPFITINRVDGACKQIGNQQRESNPTVSVIATGGEASDETAEALQGLIRHIFAISDGEIAVDSAFDAILTHGRGACRVVPEYVDDDSGDQDLFIRELDAFEVYTDPFAKLPDRADMKYAFVGPYPMPKDEYEQSYGQEHPITGGEISALTAHQQALWFPKDAVSIADYYDLVTVEEVKRRDGSTRKVMGVKWRQINGLQVLKETTLPIPRIPIVLGFGDTFKIDGKFDHRGLVRNAKQAATVINFAFTSLIEQLDAAPKSPWVIDPRQIEQFGDIWKLANRKRFPYLPASFTIDINGQETLIGPPQRQSIEAPIDASVMATRVAVDAFQSVTQLYDPSLGKPKADQSGVAVARLQGQGEMGNANYQDNLKRFLRSLGRLLIAMVPKYYDAQRIVRIEGKDGNRKTVMLHAGQPPDQSAEDLKQQQGIDAIYDIGGPGRYDVTVTTGPDFLSRKRENIAIMTEAMKAAPMTIPAWIDLFFKNLDGPVAQEIYQRLKKPDENDGPTVSGLQQKLQALGQQHDLMVKELNAKNTIIETDQVKANAAAAIKRAELESKEKIALFQGLVQESINAAKLGATADQTRIKSVADRLELLLEHAHDAAQADLEREHQTGMAAAGVGADAALSAQGHGQALEQADQSTAGQLAVQSAQPEPANA